MGSSAGALIFSRSIDTCLKDDLVIKSCNDENIVGLEDTAGFDLLGGYSILPHYKKLPEQLADTQKRVDKLLGKGLKLICLPEGISLYVNGDISKIIGQEPAEIIDNKVNVIVLENDCFTL